MKAEDYYEKGFRDALAFAAKEGRKMGRGYRKLATAHEGKDDEDWKVIAAEAAGTAILEFCKYLAKASKQPMAEVASPRT